jgi:outer membrane protein
MPEYKEAKDRLDKLSERWTKEIDERYVVLNQKKDLFLREEVLLPTEEKEKRLAELQKLETDIVELQKNRFGVGGEYFQKRQELIKPIQDKVFDAMQKTASKKNYSFIFDKANQSNLIYADKKSDLSDEVMKEMGIK